MGNKTNKLLFVIAKVLIVLTEISISAHLFRYPTDSYAKKLRDSLKRTTTELMEIMK